MIEKQSYQESKIQGKLACFVEPDVWSIIILVKINLKNSSIILARKSKIDSNRTFKVLSIAKKML